MIRPATTFVAPTATMAVVNTGLPSWRTTLNIVEARPVASGEMVANATACAGTKTWPIASPRQNISSRIARSRAAGQANTQAIIAAMPKIWRCPAARGRAPGPAAGGAGSERRPGAGRLLRQRADRVLVEHLAVGWPGLSRLQGGPAQGRHRGRPDVGSVRLAVIAADAA